MTAFVAPTDDILFSLQHVAQAERAKDWDGEIAEDILGHFAKFAEGVMAPLDEVGDTQGVSLVDGRVKMPDGFQAAYQQLAEDGWQGLSAPEEFGGMEQSALVAAAFSEVFSGANHAMQMVCNLVPGAIETLLHFGSDTQKQEWIPKLASGEVLSTMCLTEAGAGSDLSGIRCRANKGANGWAIQGEKIFISGGDQDMSAGILHLVLARSGQAEDGVKGLSLFLCQADPSVSVTRIEEKLGLHASPTCQLAFDDTPAELIGNEGEGLRAMFTVMNHARLDVALQGVAHAARAAHLSQEYASERLQGRKPDGSPASLTDHPDIQRMLKTQDALALGARAMCHIAQVELATGERPELVEFLTPLCKIFGSEAGIQSADLAIQILGGYGYLNEYRVGQTWRDARITSIYEGANGIHALSLATRGLKGKGSDVFADLIGELANGREDVLAKLAHWQGKRDAMRSSAAPAEQAHDFAHLTAQLFYHAAWARIESVASNHPNPERLTQLANWVFRT